MELRTTHGALAAELLDLEVKGDVAASRRRLLSKVLGEVRRLDRQDQARGGARTISRRDIWVLSLAAVALAVAVYLVIRG
jgi:hypothetical protein